MLLWWPARHRPDARSGFGVSLVTGAVVALAIFALQMMFEMRLDHVHQQRQRQAGRQNLELTIGLQSLEHADLTDAILSNAHQSGSCSSSDHTNMTDAVLTNVELDNARLKESNFRGADLRDADLHDSHLER